MSLISITLDEVTNNFKSKLSIEDLINFLMGGNLYQFEKQLYQSILGFYDELACRFIKAVAESDEMRSINQQYATTKGLGKLSKRPTTIQLFTGTKIGVNDYYAKKQTIEGYQGSRHLALAHWGCIQNASPMYYSTTSMLSVICPSYDVTNQVLGQLDIKSKYNSTRDLSVLFADKCMENRVPITLRGGETLAGKIVVIGIDGGRTRIRIPNGRLNGDSRYGKFDTPWKEPKLFVIHTIDEDGKTEKETLPIYDCVMGDSDECFLLLAQYLERLEIQEAKSVQFVGDGATWIWNRAKKTLMELGVKKENITETVDYYHAVSHLNDLVDALPSKIKNAKGTKLFNILKNLLWKGNIKKIIDTIKGCCKKITKKIVTQLTYFCKNEDRMKYAEFRNKNMLCGSGIVESAIRRVINLRFKCPSSFWNEGNVERLIFLRSVILSKRWDIMMNNLTNRGDKS